MCLLNWTQFTGPFRRKYIIGGYVFGRGKIRENEENRRKGKLGGKGIFSRGNVHKQSGSTDVRTAFAYRKPEKCPLLKKNWTKESENYSRLGENKKGKRSFSHRGAAHLICNLNTRQSLWKGLPFGFDNLRILDAHFFNWEIDTRRNLSNLTLSLLLMLRKLQVLMVR